MRCLEKTTSLLRSLSKRQSGKSADHYFAASADYLLWYRKEHEQRQVSAAAYRRKTLGEDGAAITLDTMQTSTAFDVTLDGASDGRLPRATASSICTTYFA